MCLLHDGFRGLMSAPEFNSDLQALVFDEVHCVTQGGADFREADGQVGNLRALAPSHVPVLGTSAPL